MWSKISSSSRSINSSVGNGVSHFIVVLGKISHLHHSVAENRSIFCSTEINLRVAIIRMVSSIGDCSLSSGEEMVETIHSVNMSLELHVILHSARVHMILWILIELLHVDASHGQVVVSLLGLNRKDSFENNLTSMSIFQVL